MFADEQLAALASPAEDATELAELLAHPDCGRFDTTLHLEVGAAELRRHIGEFFGAATPEDVLLFYYSGHGMKDDLEGSLFLCGVDSEQGLIRSTGVASSLLVSEMNASLARQQIVVLDCCYSGALPRGVVLKSPGSPDIPSALGEVTAGKGRVVLTASSSVQYAREAIDPTTGRSRSLYTAAIVDGIRSGEADSNGDGAIDPFDLHQYASDSLRATRQEQSPSIWAFGVERSPTIAWTEADPTRTPGPKVRVVRGRRAKKQRRMQAVVGILASVVVAGLAFLAVRPWLADGSVDAREAVAASPSSAADAGIVYPEELPVGARGYWWVEPSEAQEVAWSWNGSEGLKYELPWVWVRSATAGPMPVWLALASGEDTTLLELTTLIVDSGPGAHACDRLSLLSAPGSTVEMLPRTEITNECEFSVDGASILTSIHTGGSAAAFLERVKYLAARTETFPDGTFVRRSGGVDNFWIRPVGEDGEQEQVVALELRTSSVDDSVATALLDSAVTLLTESG